MHRLLRPLLLALVALLAVQPALAAPDPAAVFQQRWQQHDQLIAGGQVSRAWTWGARPLSEVRVETYATKTGSGYAERSVQYWDKGRMEILDPAGDPNALWYVSSGRLPADLILTETRLRSFGFWKDAYISVVGDPGTFPTYLDLKPLYESPARPRPERLGKPATDLLQPDLGIARFEEYARDPATVLREGQNGHLVPQAFLDFMGQRGALLRGGRRVTAPLYDQLHMFGLPITPAVWVRARVGVSERPVLVQVFERRVLTYSPTNPPATRVEIGNAGLHYYTWLTSPAGAREFDYRITERTTYTPPRDPNVVYTLEVDINTIQDGPPGNQVTRNDSASYRLYRSLDGGRTRELRYSGKTNGGCWTLLNVFILPPAFPQQAEPGKIGLWVQCSMSPSSGRGGGVEIYASYDGGQTFLFRGRD